MAEDSVDFAVAAYREDGVWQVAGAAHAVLGDVDDARRTRSAASPATSARSGMVSIDEDFFLLVRVAGPTIRVLLSDVTAATDWPLAALPSTPRPARARRRGRPAARPATSTSSPTSAWRPWTWACCATTTTSTPTRSSATSPAARLRRRCSTSSSARLRLSVPADRVRDARCARRSTRRARRWHRRRAGRRGRRSTPRAGRSAAAATPARRDADPTGHAEIVALREAAAARGAWRLDGCTLVVTLEPCTMCAGAARARPGRPAGVRGVRPRRPARSGLWDVVRDRRLNHRPEVVTGVLADEAAALLDDFFVTRRQTEEE